MPGSDAFDEHRAESGDGESGGVWRAQLVLLLDLLATVLAMLATWVTVRVLSNALLAVAAVVLLVALGVVLWSYPPFRRWWRLAVGVIGATSAVTLLGLVMVNREHLETWWDRAQECDDPTELAVMVPESDAAGLADVARRFEREHSPHACPDYHVTSFGVDWPTTVDSLRAGWGDLQDRQVDGLAPLRDIGPRPDVLVVESAAQEDQAAGAGTGAGQGDGRLIGGTPLVMAVPERFEDDVARLVRAGDGVADMVDAARAAGLDVVRASPDSSFAAARHTHALYAPDGFGALEDRKALEREIGRALEDSGLPLGDEAALLCRVASPGTGGSVIPVAVLTTERVLRSFERTGECSQESPGRMRALYPADTGSLGYRAVTTGTGSGRAREAADTFVTWLTGEEGQEALQEELLIRDVRGRVLGDPGPGVDDSPVDLARVRVAHTRIEATLGHYEKARRPARVLVLMDASASMATPADVGSARIDVAVAGVLVVAEHVDGRDEMGLWTFHGPPASSPEKLVDLGREGIASELGRVAPSGGTPLYDAIAEAVSHLREGADGSDLRAVVVITDGEDSSGAPASTAMPGQLVPRGADTAGVRLYAVAVGSASCRRTDLERITVAWNGACHESSLAGLDLTMDRLFTQFGGR